MAGIGRDWDRQGIGIGRIVRIGRLPDYQLSDGDRLPDYQSTSVTDYQCDSRNGGAIAGGARQAPFIVTQL